MCLHAYINAIHGHTVFMSIAIFEFQKCNYNYIINIKILLAKISTSVDHCIFICAYIHMCMHVYIDLCMSDYILTWICMHVSEKHIFILL